MKQTVNISKNAVNMSSNGLLKMIYYDVKKITVIVYLESSFSICLNFRLVHLNTAHANRVAKIWFLDWYNLFLGSVQLRLFVYDTKSLSGNVAGSLLYHAHKRS